MKKFGLIFLFIIVPVVFHFLFGLKTGTIEIKSPTSSMEPTIHAGSTVVYDENIKDIKRGEIVIFERNSGLFASRVIGLPGEKIVILDQGVLVENNFILYDDLRMLENNKIELSKEFNGTVISQEIVKLKGSEFFMICDNFKNAIDSRSFGPIKRIQIVGKYIGNKR